MISNADVIRLAMLMISTYGAQRAVRLSIERIGEGATDPITIAMRARIARVVADLARDHAKVSESIH